MAHADSADHGPGRVVASREIGSVSTCSCGIVTVTLQFMSLRFEPDAFKDLQELLLAAQARIDGRQGAAPLRAPTDSDPIH